MTSFQRQQDEINAAVRARQVGMQIGGHYYPKAPLKTSSCLNGCGAWMGPYRSGAPAGSDIDPRGACPLAPGPI